MSLYGTDENSKSPSSQNPNSNRYPNQFFDLSQQYMPPTIKELFKWCTFYYYNSPLIGSALKKLSRYPITDLIFEDEKEKVRDFWDDVFNKTLGIRDRLLEINLDAFVYGNCFVSLRMPSTRHLKCNSCKHEEPIKGWNWRYSSFKFHGICQKCKADGEVSVRDIAYKNIADIKIIRWNPENIDIKYNEYTGNTTYLYTVPRRLQRAITEGDKDIIVDMPLIVIDAVKSQKKIKLDKDNLKHIKSVTLAEQDQGWGKPLIIHVLKDMFYFYTMRRAQEAIAMEHILPLDIIYPMPNAQMDPYIHSDLGSWRKKIEIILDESDPPHTCRDWTYWW
jgi:hypothetical protein